ncbi:hypothetical protein CSUI_004966 [Cystoisospora suis]|uniref:Uncharacterized protein n=1 Tax=Cystoisospora suis TaxID=483139 RepID=A0A2C6KWU8_9APIC|nr:hypothetical protein CSUI_004966 [Cystoisospora suis]
MLEERARRRAGTRENQNEDRSTPLLQTLSPTQEDGVISRLHPPCASKVLFAAV